MDNWIHIKEWQELGHVTPEILKKWALLDNAYLKDQDEDLLMYRIDLIQPMYNLILNPACKRRIDLLKTLINYSEYVFIRTNDEKAQNEFNKIELISDESDFHIQLIDAIKKIKSR